MIPIPKPGKDPTNPTNYRLIALTSCTCKTILYASSHRQDNTYHGLCYTSRGVLD